MMPFEREIYVSMLLQHLEEERQRLQERIKRNQILSETLDDIFVISDQFMVSLSGTDVRLAPLQDENAYLLYF